MVAVGALIGGIASKALITGVQKFVRTRISYKGKMIGLTTAESRKYAEINAEFKESVDRILKDPTVSDYGLAIKAEKMESQIKMLQFRIEQKNEERVKKGHWTKHDLELNALKAQMATMANIKQTAESKLAEKESGTTRLHDLNENILNAENTIDSAIEKGTAKATSLKKLEIQRGWWNFCRKFPAMRYKVVNHSFNTVGVKIRKSISGIAGMFGGTEDLSAEVVEEVGRRR